MGVCKFYLSLTVHLRLEAFRLSYTNVIVIAVFELRTLLIYVANRELQICGTLFRQIILTFHLLMHLNGRFSRLTYRRFYYVIRLVFLGYCQ